MKIPFIVEDNIGYSLFFVVFSLYSIKILDKGVLGFFSNSVKRQLQSPLIKDVLSLLKEINDLLIRRLTNDKTPNCCIGDIIDYEQPTSYIVESDKYTVHGKTPVLTANKAFILGYSNEEKGIYDKGDCIIFDDFTLDFKYVDFPFKVKSSAIKILTAKVNVDIKYFYEYLTSLNLTTSEHKRHYISEIATLPLYVPTLDEQKKVLNLLLSLSAKIVSEERYLHLMENQRKYLLGAIFI